MIIFFTPWVTLLGISNFFKHVIGMYVWNRSGGFCVKTIKTYIQKYICFLFLICDIEDSLTFSGIIL